MQKLIVAFNANKTDTNRAKLQTYIRKHPMSVCLLLPAEVSFLKANGFVF